MAVTFGWKGVVDTDLQFSEFYTNDHTVVIWFLPQYPKAYAGPILSVNGIGNYLVGQGGWITQTRLISRIEGASEISLPAVLNAGQWYHLAIVRQSNRVSLFLDGLMIGSPLTLTNTNTPSGILRLGRSGPLTQFYGMMDELAVYTRALTSTEIQT